MQSYNHFAPQSQGAAANLGGVTTERANPLVAALGGGDISRAVLTSGDQHATVGEPGRGLGGEPVPGGLP